MIVSATVDDVQPASESTFRCVEGVTSPSCARRPVAVTSSASSSFAAASAPGLCSCNRSRGLSCCERAPARRPGGASAAAATASMKLCAQRRFTCRPERWCVERPGRRHAGDEEPRAEQLAPVSAGKSHRRVEMYVMCARQSPGHRRPEETPRGRDISVVDRQRQVARLDTCSTPTGGAEFVEHLQCLSSNARPRGPPSVVPSRDRVLHVRDLSQHRRATISVVAGRVPRGVDRCPAPGGLMSRSCCARSTGCTGAADLYVPQPPDRVGDVLGGSRRFKAGSAR